MADHPIHLVRRFHDRVDAGEFRAIGESAAWKYRTDLSEVDPYERLAQLYATKARLIDKLALYNALIARAIGEQTISDEEALAVLVGWATIEGKRWLHREVDR